MQRSNCSTTNKVLPVQSFIQQKQQQFIMTKQTALNRSAQNDKKILPHHGGHTYTKSKNSLRRNHHPRHPQAHSKNLKFVSKTCPNVIVEAVFQKLDLKIPEQAKRLQARRKMISYGKVRTIGRTWDIGKERVQVDDRCCPT